jgi:hypothetical protein
MHTKTRKEEGCVIVMLHFAGVTELDTIEALHPK